MSNIGVSLHPIWHCPSHSSLTEPPKGGVSCWRKYVGSGVSRHGEERKKNTLLLLHSTCFSQCYVSRHGSRKCCICKRHKPIPLHEFLQFFLRQSAVKTSYASKFEKLPSPLYTLCVEAVSFFSVLNHHIGSGVAGFDELWFHFKLVLFFTDFACVCLISFSSVPD